MPVHRRTPRTAKPASKSRPRPQPLRLIQTSTLPAMPLPLMAAVVSVATLLVWSGLAHPGVWFHGQTLATLQDATRWQPLLAALTNGQWTTAGQWFLHAITTHTIPSLSSLLLAISNLTATQSLHWAWLNGVLTVATIGLWAQWVWRRTAQANPRQGGNTWATGLSTGLFALTPAVLWSSMAPSASPLLGLLWVGLACHIQQYLALWHSGKTPTQGALVKHNLGVIALFGLIAWASGEAWPTALLWSGAWGLLLITEPADQPLRFAPTPQQHGVRFSLLWGGAVTSLFVGLSLIHPTNASALGWVAPLLATTAETLRLWTNPMAWAASIWAALPVIAVALGCCHPKPNSIKNLGRTLLLAAVGLLCLPISPMATLLPWAWWLTRLIRNLTPDTPIPRTLAIGLDVLVVGLLLLCVAYTATLLQGLGLTYPGSHWPLPGNPTWDPLPEALALPVPVWKWALLPFGLLFFPLGLGLFWVNRQNQLGRALLGIGVTLAILWVGATSLIVPTFSRLAPSLPHVSPAFVTKLPSTLQAQVWTGLTLDIAPPTKKAAPASHLLASDTYFNDPDRARLRVASHWPLWHLNNPLPEAVTWGVAPLPLWAGLEKPPLILLHVTPRQ